MQNRFAAPAFVPLQAPVQDGSSGGDVNYTPAPPTGFREEEEKAVETNSANNCQRELNQEHTANQASSEIDMDFFSQLANSASRQSPRAM